MNGPSTEIVRGQLDRIRSHYDSAPSGLTSAARQYRTLLAHYFNLLIPAGANVLEVGCGSGELLAQLNAGRKTGIDLSEKQIAAARARMPEATFLVQAGEQIELEGTFDIIIISDTLNQAADVQLLLTRLHRVSHEGTRLILNFHSSLWRPVFAFAGALGWQRPAPGGNWLATSDILNLLQLSEWRTVTSESRILLPLAIPGLERLCNRWIAPLLPSFCLCVFTVARPTRAIPATRTKPTVSIIIPARNEAGNIAAAVARTPELGGGTEIIFVEGHSRDNTWAEIQRVTAAHPERRIKCLQQSGRGKGDAVRAGFSAATGDILMILDADLTMPPEELPKFYDAVVTGRAEFANGCRLVYPMDERAMQFLNLCANKTFGLIFSWLLGQPVKDTLCGTKVLSRAHYEQIAANRAHFGDFDPFGDFDLLFGAARLNLRIADIPIRYKERTYGTTNIQRWKHGWLLLRMVLFAAKKIKFV
jgi:SAM-dependent methyltransferase